MRHRGAALLIVLVALAIGVAAVGAVAVAFRSVALRHWAQRSESRARIAAQSALAVAMAAVGDMPDGAVTLGDEPLITGLSGATTYRLDGATFRVQVMDACALLNLNQADEAQLLAAGLLQNEVDALLDWRESASGARPEGAKDEYYEALTNPYHAALSPLQLPSELLQIRHFTTRLVYGDMQGVTGRTREDGDAMSPLARFCTVWSQSPVRSSDGQELIDLNNAQPQQLVERGLPLELAQQIIDVRTQVGSFTSMQEILQLPAVTPDIAALLLDQTAVGTATMVQGRVNLNTAPYEVISTIPGLSAAVAQAIADGQSSGYSSYDDLNDVAGMDMESWIALADRCTLTTASFLVRALGRAGDVQVALEALIEVRDGRAVIRRVWEAPYADPAAYWGWDSATSDEIDLSGAT